MNNLFFQGMPRPTIGGIIFNLCMLAAPFIGRLFYGDIGFVIGLAVGSIGLIWFFFFRGRRGLACEICSRPVTNLGRGTPLGNALNMGTFFDTNSLRQGSEGPGDECQRCGRIYCTTCAQVGMTCRCGSKDFRTVRLKYQ